MFDVTALGELLIDFTPEPTPPGCAPRYSQNPGGAPANVLAAARALGASAALISRVGDDPFGDFLTQTVADRGIDTTGVSRDPKIPTTLAFVHLAPDGDRSFRFYRNPGADIMLSRADLPGGLMEQSRIFHFGSVSMTADPARDATLFAAQMARDRAQLVSYDPNYRAPLWPSEAEAVAQMKRPLPLVDILKVSEEELPLLTGETDVEQGSRLLTQQGISLVLVSLGARGACYRLGKLFGYLPTYAVDTVDTTGAGDAFLGAMLYRLRSLDREALCRLTREELEDMVDFANAAGALATTRRGAIAIMPTLDEVERCRTATPKQA